MKLSTVSTLLGILLIALITLLPLSGCRSNRGGASAIPAAQSFEKPASQGFAEATNAEKPLVEAENASVSLPDSPQKPIIITALARLRAWYTVNLQGWESAVSASKEVDRAIKQRDAKIEALENQLAEIKKPDPVKGWLYLVGIGLIVAGSAGLIASFFVSALFAFPWVRSAAAGGLVLGFLLVTIAHFLTQIYWISAGCIVAAILSGGIYLYTHRKIIKSRLKKAGNPIAP